MVMGDDPRVLLLATMDTKGNEAIFVRDCLRRAGAAVRVMDAGIRGQSPVPVDISREQVASAAGTTLEQVQKVGHEGKALDFMIAGATVLARQAFENGEIAGVLGLGGSMGTTLGTAVMRALPLGSPKVMISTMASRDTRAFVGTKDIMMQHAVCDLAGVNRITRMVLRNGALAMAGMLRAGPQETGPARPLVVLSTLGTTEACAQLVRARLEEAGFEVVIFHTVGSGGQAMDEFIASGQVDAVVDLSLHELADHAFGGDYDAGPERARVGLSRGLPTVLIPGNIDFLVTGPMYHAERRFPGRQYHAHNAAITVVNSRTEELVKMAAVLGELRAGASGPVEVMIPAKGLSAFGAEQGPFHDPGNMTAFIEAVQSHLGEKAAILPWHVNDQEFGLAVTEALLRLVGHDNNKSQPGGVVS